MVYSNVCAVLLYTFISGYLFYTVKNILEVNKKALLSLLMLALCCHGIACYQTIWHETGIYLGLFSVSSLIFFTVNAIVLVSAIKKPVYKLYILLLPLTIASIICSLIFSQSTEPLKLTLGLASHVVFSIMAYSLLTIATLQALFIAYQNHQLKNKQALNRLQSLPPLQTMEILLFEMLWAGYALLTLSIISGIVFLEDLFAQHVAHKTTFTLCAWLIYSTLLWGRHQLGWRGYKAIRWTLVGFLMLMLAYFGSKLVLEFILTA